MREKIICRGVLGWVCLFAVVGCGLRGRSGVIDRAGAYPSPGGSWELSVRIDRDGLVNHNVEKTATGKTVITDGGFSTCHRRFFYWDTGARLWCQNSDLGRLRLWQDDGTGAWSATDVKPGFPLIGSIPAPVRERLPDTKKKELGIP
jgi:hypothetical protein